MPAGARAAAGVIRRTVGGMWRTSLIWAYVFAAFVATSAWGYAATYKSAAQREIFAATFGSNPGFNALIGPARDLGSVAGFTEWRSLGILSVVGGVWGLLTATKLLRGEEDAGRWELLLSGATSRRKATAAAVGAMGYGLVVIYVFAAAAGVAVGRLHSVGIGPGAAIFLAVSLICGAAVFLMVGALCSQLAPTRRLASAYAGVALSIAYVLRMLADSGIGVGWLRWVTPLGWIEALHPLTQPRPLALLPIVVLVAGLGAASVLVAGARDYGAGVTGARQQARRRRPALRGTNTLNLRTAAGSSLAWIVALGVGGLLLGLIAKSAGRALALSTTAERVLSRLGAGGGGGAAWLGVTFLVVAMAVSVVAATHVTAIRGEEADGRLANLLAAPVSRGRWLGERISLALAALLLTAAVAGFTAWAGAASQGTGIGLGRLLAAGMNTVPAAVVVLGAGILALGLRPGLASATAYGLMAWSALLELVGTSLRANHWLMDTSLFSHLAAAPAVTPNWASAAVLAAIGCAAGATGIAAFCRRDIAGG